MKNETMRDSELIRRTDNEKNPRESTISTPQLFANNDNGDQGGTHWTSLYTEDKKCFFDGFWRTSR